MQRVGMSCGGPADRAVRTCPCANWLHEQLLLLWTLLMDHLGCVYVEAACCMESGGSWSSMDRCSCVSRPPIVVLGNGVGMPSSLPYAFQHACLVRVDGSWLVHTMS
jgi:hypothetical protein